MDNWTIGGFFAITIGMSKTAMTLKIRSIDDLLGVVPHLLGFQPTESLVLVVAEGGRVVVTARADLAEVARPGAAEELLGRITIRFPDASFWLIAYGTAAAQCWQVLGRCERFLPADTVAYVVRVDGRRWWADSPDAPPGVYSPSGNALSELAARHGLPARPSRADLATLVQADPDVDPGAFARAEGLVAATSASHRPELMRQTLAESLGGQPDDARCARLAVLADDSDARDVALLSMDSEDAAAHLTLWRRVVRRCLPSYQAQVLGLLGMAAWIAGDGALSVICLERAEALEPGLPLVEILKLTNAMMVSPDSWPEIRRKIAPQPQDAAPQPQDAAPIVPARRSQRILARRTRRAPRSPLRQAC